MTATTSPSRGPAGPGRARGTSPSVAAPLFVAAADAAQVLETLSEIERRIVRAREFTTRSASTLSGGLADRALVEATTLITRAREFLGGGGR